MSWDLVVDEAAALVADATGEGLVLRVVGSTGIRMHCDRAASDMSRLERKAKDIDLVCLSGDRKGVRRLLEQRGYQVNRDMLVAMEGTRFLFHHPDSGMELDLFVDRLDFCHTIELTKRLEVDEMTIPIEELLLQKLQVHDITHTDLVDTIVLLAGHEVGDPSGTREEIDAEFIVHLLARDWGFCRTATENLARVRRAMEGGAVPAIEPDDCERVQQRATALLEAIGGSRKSLSWRMRERVGERMQWWQDVSDRRDSY